MKQKYLQSAKGNKLWPCETFRNSHNIQLCSRTPVQMIQGCRRCDFRRHAQRRHVFLLPALCRRGWGVRVG